MKPKSIQSITRLSLSALAVGILTACGGGGSGGLDVADGGIRGTGSSVGPVSGFGSVIVNGTTFKTEQIPNKEVESNDGIGCERNCENPLQKGMILQVKGEWRTDGTGEAESLEYDDTFRGTVTDVTVTERTAGGQPAAGTFRILGQTITYDRRTVIRLGTTFANAADFEGELVRVSAWKSGDDYRSSFIGQINALPGGQVELEGPVSRFNEELRAFRIGTQEIIYHSEDVFKGELDASDLEEGNVSVEVEGVVEADGTVTASTLRWSDSRRFLGQEDEDIEISGPVENYSVTTSEFLINGVTVAITDETEFDDIARSRLQNGLLVQVEGEFVNGVIVAEEIELLEGDAEVKAEVTGEGLLNNSWVVGGVTVVVSNYTLIDVDDELSVSISKGSFLEVEGIERETDNGLVYIDALAIEIEDEGDDEFELQGRLSPDSIYGDTLTVLGLQMSVLPDALDYEDDDDNNFDDCRYLEVSYRESSVNSYEATKIECDD